VRTDLAMDITPDFNELLRERNAPPTRSDLNLDKIDGFLKDALRIVQRFSTPRRKPELMLA
jgi:hypothetical protein